MSRDSSSAVPPDPIRSDTKIFRSRKWIYPDAASAGDIHDSRFIEGARAVLCTVQDDVVGGEVNGALRLPHNESPRHESPLRWAVVCGVPYRSDGPLDHAELPKTMHQCGSLARWAGMGSPLPRQFVATPSVRPQDAVMCAVHFLWYGNPYFPRPTSGFLCR